MKINFKQTGKSLIAALALGAAMTMVSCSSNDEPNPTPKDPEVTYKGNVAYSAGILFNEGKEMERRTSISPVMSPLKKGHTC